MNPALIALVAVFCFASVLSENLDLLLLHTNDMHGKFEEITPLANSCSDIEKNRGTCVGGFARLANEIRRYRKWGKGNGRSVLFLNAGDTFIGSDWYSVHKWKICSEFLNALEPDVLTLGNHEFDEGIEELKQFVQSLNCPIVSANFNVSRVQPVKKSTVIEVSGRKIGIVGYLTQETAFLSNTEDLKITDELAAVRTETERLTKEGIDIIIGLGHSGFSIDKMLAKEVPLLDIVIGGHSNTFLWNGPKPHEEVVEGPYPTVITQKSGKKVPVVQAYAYTLYLGRLNVTFDENGDLVEFEGQPEYLSSDVEQDQDILNLLEKFRPAVMQVKEEVIGKSSVYLDGNCRSHECNLGNLITDAMVYYLADKNRDNTGSWTNVAVAIYNSGSLRNSINVTDTKGNIMKGELLQAIPFANEIVSVILKGSNLLSALEHTVDSNEENFKSAQFLQVSGLRVEYDLKKEIGHRVQSVQIRCADCSIPTYKPLNTSESYRVMMPDFILHGGDGFNMIKENETNVIKYNISVIDLMLWYLKKQTPVYSEVQGRLTFSNSSNPPNSCSGIHPSLWIIVINIVCFVMKDF